MVDYVETWPLVVLLSSEFARRFSLGHNLETAGQFRTSMLALQKPKAYDPSSDHSVRQNVIQTAFLRAGMQQTVALANRGLNNHLIGWRILTARENYLPE